MRGYTQPIIGSPFRASPSFCEIFYSKSLEFNRNSMVHNKVHEISNVERRNTKSDVGYFRNTNIPTNWGGSMNDISENNVG